MRTFIRSIFVLIVVSNLACLTPQKATAQVSVNFQVFYDELSPYGMWVNNPNYGYVWVPNVSPGFTPYGSNGYWVYTDYGWTWVSDYPWGWAPFHYGRWFTDAEYGPMWVPGNEWGPGWVSWRRSEGYYGWAPIEPGISINVAYSEGYHVQNDRWRFVRDRDFGRSDINSHYMNSSDNVNIMQHSKVINNLQVENKSKVRYNQGPDRNEIQKQTGSKIEPVVLKEDNKPGQHLQDGKLEIYRPKVETNISHGNKPASSKIAELKDVKPVKERNSAVQPQKDDQQNKSVPFQDPKNVQPGKIKNDQQQKDEPIRQQSVPEKQNNNPDKQQIQKNEQPGNMNPSKQEKVNQPDNSPSKQHDLIAPPQNQHQPDQRPPQQKKQEQQQPQQKQQDQHQPKQQQQQNQRSTQPVKQQQSPSHPPVQDNKQQPSKQQQPQQQQQQQQQKHQQPQQQPQHQPQPQQQQQPQQHQQQPQQQQQQQEQPKQQPQQPGSTPDRKDDKNPH